ncbi:aminotransferase class I/II-fold pyridoxal phosphate-dependent enzyme [Zunongwangia sp.]|uniref:aminotransferase class I/II-fold pyridoxal phosphate-dependent enzyme n=1 Tax=Zunongwangia sp. TaxID=1965325 RepID=UPI003AA7D2A1
MNFFPEKLRYKLDSRKEQQNFRILSKTDKDLFDFYSNDYLAFSNSESIFIEATRLCEKFQLKQNGATGSRLISGNHKLFDLTENFLAEFHQAESALVFNSGYDANLGFFSSVPQKGDFIFYDELIHASIRDGISLSNAKAYKFKHNNIEDLQAKISRQKPSENASIYIVTEAIFSMDGDQAPLLELANFSEKNNHFLIVDEAHSTGIFGENGSGLVNQFQLQEKVFARIHTFGKAMGCHGAVILGSQKLKSYLVNFARSFIYTTGLPPHTIATIYSAFQQLKIGEAEIGKLKANIQYFKKQLKIAKIDSYFIESESPIQCAIVSGNESVKKIATSFQQSGFLVKPILSPTVSKGSERLRFCLHSFNSEEEINSLINLLSESLKSI